METFKIGNLIKYITFGFLFLATLSSIQQIFNPESGSIIVAIIFTTLSIYLNQLSKSKLIITEQVVELLLFFGNKQKAYSINWNEVQKIYTDGRTIALANNNKCLTFSLFATNNSDKEKIQKHLENYASKFNVEFVWQQEIVTKQINVEKEGKQ